MKALDNYLIESTLKKGAIDPAQSKQDAGDKTSDSSLYYRMGRFKYEWKPDEDKKKLEKAHSINPNDPRKGLIGWQRKEAYVLLPDELECIHRKDWELDILDGVSEDALNHKHYDIWWDHIYKTHQPRNKILTVFECSNQKPYCSTHVAIYYALRWSDYTDFASMDYGIQQWEYTPMYPSRWDEWDHYKEDPRMQYLYAEKTKKRILEYHKHFPQYEKIIFICQNNHPQRPVNELWEDNTNNFRDWAIILTDDEFRKGIHRAKPDVPEGILIQRTLSMNYTHKKYAELLASLYPKKEDKEKIKERVKLSSSECKKIGLWNPFDEDLAKRAYKEGISPFDKDFMNKVAEEIKQTLQDEESE